MNIWQKTNLEIGKNEINKYMNNNFQIPIIIICENKIEKKELENHIFINFKDKILPYYDYSQGRSRNEKAHLILTTKEFEYIRDRIFLQNKESNKTFINIYSNSMKTNRII